MIRAKHSNALLIASLCTLTAAAGAGQAGQEKTVTVISPIFSQLLSFQVPARLSVHPSEQTSAKNYLRESVADGETVEHWTQMITVSGARDAASAPGMSAGRVAQNFAAGFKEACPATFAFKDMGEVTISGQPADAIVTGCGSVADEGGAAGAVHSETALVMVIVGKQDLYTVQWAERGASSPAPLPFDAGKWQGRLKTLAPVKLCPIVAGEKAPYPSCVGKG